MRRVTCAPVQQPERGTSHFVAVDRWGDVASETSTIESGFGSGLMVNGYYLNNELTDFSFVPEKDGCPVANRVEGGKRPRSSMSPTIVYGPDGRVMLAVGAAGGSTIIAQVAKAIIGVIDWHLSAQDAIALADDLSRPGDTVYRRKRAPSSKPWSRSCRRSATASCARFRPARSRPTRSSG